MSSVKHINNFSVNSNEILVRFDVVCWFISVSVRKPLYIVLEVLSFDKLLCSRIFLTCLTLNMALIFVFLVLFSLIINLFASKRLAHLFVLASLHSLLRYTWNILKVRLSLRFTPHLSCG